MNIKPTILTLALPITSNQVLLGLKKKGLGAGKWNGFGGKVEIGESIEQAARRELEEEVGILATAVDLSGIVHITYQDTAELAAGLSLAHKKLSSAVEMHVFRVIAWENSPTETVEMAPRWFSASEIPYNEMWLDDRYWLPLVLEGKHFEMHCVFRDKNTLLSHTVHELQPAAVLTLSTPGVGVEEF